MIDEDDDSEAEQIRHCPACDEELAPDELSCPVCGAPRDEALTGICAFCGVATDERCGGCGMLVCKECGDDARTGATSASEGVPWCVDCRAGAGM